MPQGDPSTIPSCSFKTVTDYEAIFYFLSWLSFYTHLVFVDCKVDIAFLMDGSWSIGKRRFKIQKDFLVEVSQVINVGVAGPMMGIIQYG